MFGDMAMHGLEGVRVHQAQDRDLALATGIVSLGPGFTMPTMTRRG